MQDASKPETAADLGDRLDQLNTLVVRWLAGEIVRSVRRQDCCDPKSEMQNANCRNPPRASPSAARALAALEATPAPLRLGGAP